MVRHLPASRSWREALGLLAALLSAYLLMLPLVAGDAGAGERLALIGPRGVIDVILVLAVGALAYGVLGLLAGRWPRLRLWGFRLVALCMLAVLLAQLVFRKETGMYFSGQVALYALSNFAELSKVLTGSASNLSSAAMVLFAAAAIAVPILVRDRAAWLPVTLASAVLPALVLVSQLVALNQEGAGRRFAAESAMLALLQPPYPDAAGGAIPTYEAPHIASAPVAAAGNPDIILVLLESTRAISVPPFDSGTGPRAEMPVLRELARRSRVFQRAYTTTSHTSKALVGIHCGIHPYPEMRVVEAGDAGIPAPCLPGLLKDAGYRSLFMQSATQRFENRPGLVANIGFDTGLYKEQIADGHASSGYFGLDEAAIPPKFAQWWGAQGESPRFVTILTSMTHHPYQEVGKAAATGDEGQRQAYLNVLSYTDRMLGQVLEAVKASGRAGNTIVVVTGDHGESFGEHGPRQHDSVPFEEVTRVPLLVWDGRGTLPVGEDTALRQHVDLLPTLVGLVGGKATGGPGVDLFDPAGHAEVVTSCWYAGACMSKVTPQLKWIYAPAARKLLAFDLARDPDERDDVSGRYSPSQRQDIAMALLQHQESVRRLHDAGRWKMTSGEREPGKGASQP